MRIGNERITNLLPPITLIIIRKLAKSLNFSVMQTTLFHIKCFFNVNIYRGKVFFYAITCKLEFNFTIFGLY
jgi:hypothetical protein